MKQPIKNWIIATRPWSFPASTMPVVLTISYLFLKQESLLHEVNWWFGIVSLIGVVFTQAAGNLISDYFDFKNQIDRKESFGSSRMLIEEIFKPKTILTFGLVLLAIVILIGLTLTIYTGNELIWIGLIGVLGTYFYYVFKSIALGDLLIFIIYGPLIGMGTAFVMTTELLWEVLLLNVPVAMLVVNILHANNTRDIKHDAMANIKTQAMMLGIKGAKIHYVVLALGAYIVLIIMNALGMVHPLTLLVLLTIPIALKNIRVMMQADIEKPEIIKDLDAMSAQLVMIFSLLFSVLNFISKAL
ncbi:MAG: prenyltransferase [Paludibacter sp.]|nr:prenyltransferase [Paludibacter sp.]MDD4427434.1 prenyltransferase [Paludibacter sp.]